MNVWSFSANGVAILAWVAGAVMAPGWWKVAAFFFPPYPWYLVAERILQGVCR